jgi:hypothetical protein
MIGKITIGKSFRGCISYMLEDKLNLNKEILLENRAELICYNQCFGNKKELITQFNDVRYLNPKLAKPVMHISLSLSQGEKLDKAALTNLAEDCAVEMGFDKNQYIAVTHKDTAHQHIHIVVNRVGFDGKTLSDSNNFKKIAAFCRKAELKYHLQEVLSPVKFLPKEMRQTLRFDARKQALRNDIRLILLESKNYPEFESKMIQKGYEVIKGRGIAFRDEKKMYTKGSELVYSLSSIDKILQLPLSQKQAFIQKQIQKEKQLIPRSKSTSHHVSRNRDQNMESDFGRAIEILLRPEYENNETPHELLKKKREGKYRSQHL